MSKTHGNISIKDKIVNNDNYIFNYNEICVNDKLYHSFMLRLHDSVKYFSVFHEMPIPFLQGSPHYELSAITFAPN